MSGKNDENRQYGLQKYLRIFVHYFSETQLNFTLYQVGICIRNKCTLTHEFSLLWQWCKRLCVLSYEIK
jgi:hypothetical protein